MTDMIETYSVKKASLALGISASTVRKHLLLLESNGANIARDPQNTRILYDADIVALRRLHDMAQEGQTLDRAAKVVAEQLTKRDEHMGNPPAKNDAHAIRELTDEVKELRLMIVKMNEEREEERQAFKLALRMIEKQANVIEEIKKPEPVEEVKQTGWFSKLFQKY